jgi:hypothetical protein
MRTKRAELNSIATTPESLGQPHTSRDRPTPPSRRRAPGGATPSTAAAPFGFSAPLAGLLTLAAAGGRRLRAAAAFFPSPAAAFLAAPPAPPGHGLPAAALAALSHPALWKRLKG